MVDQKTWWGRLMIAVKYRPGAVSLYVLYGAVPIVIYVAYLIRRSYEESVVELVLRSVGDRPWLWGAALLVSFAVLAFVAYMCCGPRVDPEAEVKKTDAVVEDDPHQEEVEETSEKTSKADLEGPEPEADTSDTTPLVDSEAAGDGQRKRKPRKE